MLLKAIETWCTENTNQLWTKKLILSFSTPPSLHFRCHNNSLDQHRSYSCGAIWSLPHRYLNFCHNGSWECIHMHSPSTTGYPEHKEVTFHQLNPPQGDRHFWNFTTLLLRAIKTYCTENTKQLWTWQLFLFFHTPPSLHIRCHNESLDQYRSSTCGAIWSLPHRYLNFHHNGNWECIHTCSPSTTDHIPSTMKWHSASSNHLKRIDAFGISQHCYWGKMRHTVQKTQKRFKHGDSLCPSLLHHPFISDATMTVLSNTGAPHVGLFGLTTQISQLPPQWELRVHSHVFSLNHSTYPQHNIPPAQSTSWWWTLLKFHNFATESNQDLLHRKHNKA